MSGWPAPRPRPSGGCAAWGSIPPASSFAEAAIAELGLNSIAFGLSTTLLFLLVLGILVFYGMR